MLTDPKQIETLAKQLRIDQDYLTRWLAIHHRAGVKADLCSLFNLERKNDRTRRDEA